MTAQEIIRQATLKARAEFDAFFVSQQVKMMEYFEQAAIKLDMEIYRRAASGLKGDYLLGIRAEVHKTIAKLRTQINAHIKSGMAHSVDYGMMSGIKGLESVLPAKYKIGLGNSWIDKANNVHRYNAALELYSQSTWFRINAQAMEHLIRFNPSGIMFSESIWKNLAVTQQQLRSTIIRGLIIGESPAQLSKDIRGFLHEPEKLFRRVKYKKTGKLRLSKAASEYHPGQGVYRSSYMNAMRVSVTEYARAYSEGTIRYAESKNWIKGYIWRTGGLNPCADCLDLEGQYFKKGEQVGIPLHPLCKCWYELIIDEKII